MKLWLVCFLILFLGAEAAQWLGQLPWMASIELSLPLTVIGGIGLAIASNYRHWPRLGPLPPSPEPSPLPSTLSPPSPTAEPPVPAPKASRKADTISFEIKRPGR